VGDGVDVVVSIGDAKPGIGTTEDFDACPSLHWQFTHRDGEEGLGLKVGAILFEEEPEALLEGAEDRGRESPHVCNLPAL